MTDALIVDAVRSPIGRRNGSLAGTRGDELAAQVLNGLIARHDLDPGEVLVSGTVRDLVAGSGFTFEDLGERELKGAGSWRLFRVLA